jgi:uroporphyrinogen-III decarboxylase
MDTYELRKVYGDSITIMGHIDLFAWNEDKIKREIEQAEKEFISGGFILGSSCGLSPLIPLNKIRTLYRGWNP